MNSFANAVETQEVRTENGMKAQLGTADSNVDLFFKGGALRGKDIIPLFSKAYHENSEVALRIALWLRDVRQGAGERTHFRNILNWLANSGHEDHALQLMRRVPELGRWDDLLSIENDKVRKKAYELISIGLAAKDALCAKWMPRKGSISLELREHLGMSPKQYRKTLVNLTKVVETQMCARDWDNINFSHVPSRAHSIYKKAFGRNTPKYAKWLEALVKKEDPKVKVNAGAIYPHDVIKEAFTGYWLSPISETKHTRLMDEMWEALPNYMGEAKVIPIVDTSGSMFGGSPSALQVAIGLGLYAASKNKGAFNGVMMNFSSTPKMRVYKGKVSDMLNQMTPSVMSDWGGSTNLHAAFSKILDTAKSKNVSQDEMPQAVLIMSDMQFNSCVVYDDSAMEMIKRKYQEAGYEMPGVIFWNLRATSNVPASFNSKGVALISGYSPSIMKSVLSANFDDMTPKGIMWKTIGSERYDS